jgi:hypothetical protein
MNESILSRRESNTEEPPPVAATPEEKRKGLSASSLMKIQALMDNPKSENVHSFTSRFRYVVSNYLAMKEDYKTYVLVDGAWKLMSGMDKTIQISRHS